MHNNNNFLGWHHTSWHLVSLTFTTFTVSSISDSFFFSGTLNETCLTKCYIEFEVLSGKGGRRGLCWWVQPDIFLLHALDSSLDILDSSLDILDSSRKVRRRCSSPIYMQSGSGDWVDLVGQSSKVLRLRKLEPAARNGQELLQEGESWNLLRIGLKPNSKSTQLIQQGDTSYWLFPWFRWFQINSWVQGWVLVKGAYTKTQLMFSCQQNQGNSRSPCILRVCIKPLTF